MRLSAGTNVVLILLCAGCATLEKQQWVQSTKTVAASTFDKVSGATGKAAARMQDYLARKDVLQKFYDAGEHSEDAVLKVLRQAGVASTQNPTTKPASGGGAKAAKKASGAPAGDTVIASNKPTDVPKKVTSKFPENYGGSYRWPLDAGIVSSEFGARWGKVHKGLDIAADVGEPVYAVAAGEIIYAGSGMSGYGNVVIVRHDIKVTSLYAHNSALKVTLGQKVNQGEQIALVGSTGRSTGPHVHFEIRSGNNPVSPRTLLPKSMNALLLPPSLSLDGNQLFAQALPMSTPWASLQ